MKKILALLMVFAVMAFATVPVFAADDTVSSVEQNAPIDKVPDVPGSDAPQTGEEFPILPVAGAVVFASAAGVIFFIASKKKKENKEN